MSINKEEVLKAISLNSITDLEKTIKDELDSKVEDEYQEIKRNTLNAFNGLTKPEEGD